MSRDQVSIAVTGWYGHDNVGDQLLACSVLAALRREVPGARLTLLTADLRDGAHLDVPVMPPLWPEHHWLSLRGLRHLLAHTVRTRGRWVGQLARLDLLIVGGGSLLHDRRPENLGMWLRLLRLYRAAGARIVLYGVGLDPVAPGPAEALRDAILRLADGITARDRASAALAAAVAGPERVRLAADPVLGCPLITPRPPAAPAALGPPTIALNLRPLAGAAPGDVEAAGASLAEALLERVGATLAFLPLGPGDAELGRAIRDRLPDALAARVQLLPHLPRQLSAHVALYSRIDLVVAMRLHALVVGAATGVPGVGLVYDPKVAAFLNEAGLGDYAVAVAGPRQAWRGIDVAAVVRAAGRALEDGARLRKAMAGRVEALRRRERESIRLVQAVLEHPGAGGGRRPGSPISPLPPGRAAARPTPPEAPAARPP